MAPSLPPQPLVGALGPYRLERRLGRGGMGEVWQAYDPRLDRRVAVKWIRAGSPDGGAEQGSTLGERFLREARTVARLSHPAIVQIFDILTVPEEPPADGDAPGPAGAVLVLELVDGRELGELLGSEPLGLSRALALAEGVARGLGAAHRAGIVHRDLKPGNVMVTGDDQVKILDFGIARWHRPEAGDDTLSPDGAVPGTFRAMSPEQARGLPVDARSDLFALGSLLAEMVTGRHPFAAATAAETLMRVCTRPPELGPALPGAEPPELPPALLGLLGRLLEKDPALRPPSAEAVAESLGEIRRRLGRGDRASQGADGDTTLLWGAPVPGGEGPGEAGSGEATGPPVSTSSGSPSAVSPGRSSGSLEAPRATDAGDLRSAGVGSGSGPATGDEFHTWRPWKAAGGRASRLRAALLALGAGAVTVSLAASLLWQAGLPERPRSAPDPSVAAPAAGARAAGEVIHLAVPTPHIAHLAGAEATPGDRELAERLRRILLQELVAYPRVRALDPGEVDPVIGPGWEEDIPRLARALGADEVLVVDLACGPPGGGGGRCRGWMERVRGADGARLERQALQLEAAASPAELGEVIRRGLGRQLGGPAQGLGSGREPARASAGSGSLSSGSSPAAYGTYMELLREHEAEARPVDQLLADLEPLLAKPSPGGPGGFVEPRLLAARMLRLRFHDWRDPADLDRALELLDEAEALAPRDPRVFQERFSVALKGERLEEAAAALALLEALGPEDPRVALQRARLLERQGQPEAALVALEEAMEGRRSWALLLDAAAMEYRIGTPEAARQTLEELLDRFPGSRSGRALLAQIELLHGDLERAAGLYRELVDGAPGGSPSVTELNNLALVEMLLRRYGEAERALRWLIEAPGKPGEIPEGSNIFALLNLADVVALQGREGEALALYQRVLEGARRDPAADHWQTRSVAAQALAHLGRTEEAVALTQEILRQAPENGQALFEAALVYAVVGEEASARVTARRALDREVEGRWFELAWFDGLGL